MNGFEVAKSVASWLYGQDQKRALKYVDDMEQRFNSEPKFVYLVTRGSGADGDEWDISRIYASKEKAEKFIEENGIAIRQDGSTYSLGYQIEEWEVQ